MDNRKDFIVNLVKEAQNIVRDKVSETYNISIKNDNQSDLVTEVDIAIEKFLVQRISEAYPNDGFITEENTVPIEEAEYVWIIDPIDGTMNFVYTLSDFAISVGLYKNKVGVVGVVCDVMKDETFVAEKGKGAYLNNLRISNLEPVTVRQSIVDVSLKTMTGLRKAGRADLLDMANQILSHRNLGSAALRICHIAMGRIHLYISDTLCVWDFAAGAIILEEVGGYHNYMDEDMHFGPGHFDFFGGNSRSQAEEFKEKFFKEM